MSDRPLWHTLSTEDALARLGSSGEGLSGEEARRRLEAHGPNELAGGKRVSPWALFAEQFKDVLIVILLIATGASAFLGNAVEAMAIAVIVLFAVVLGFIQEVRAERALDALRRMAAPGAAVVRGGEEQKVPAREVVPGDVIALRAGDRCPADGRLLEAPNLEMNESALTGESQPVAKATAPLDDGALQTADRTNMVYAGTTASYGRGRAAVVATGMDTEFGRIAGMLETVETGKTTLQRALDRLGRVLAWAALGVVAAVVAMGLYRGQPFVEMLLFGIALAVAVVPEALPAVVTISLALGVRRMVRRNALVRRLPAVEALGSVSIICSDKTGTLTRDEMTVRKIVTAGRSFNLSGAGYEPEGELAEEGRVVEVPPEVERLLKAAALASDARLVWGSEGGQPGAAEDGKAGDRATGAHASQTGDDAAPWRIQGDPTEGALVVAAAKAGLAKDALDRECPRCDEIPFTSERKRMTTLHRCGEATVAFAKGAPEVILEACSRRSTGDGEAELDAAAREEILATARTMAEEALRVLAVAERPGATKEDAEEAMTFLGLVGMIDPPRPEVEAAMATCEAAGIRPLMITGDHPVTATAVARELGMLDGGRVVTGGELEAMSDAELGRRVEEVQVYARVSPAHKLRVVTAWQKRGHLVAMTGDGVNDAPALKKADMGVAMGIKGTDVSREAADMTLTDDNFASIVAAVEEGRKIVGNIKKYLMYLLSSNIGELGLVAAASFAGLPLPLTAVQILYVNLATDGLPALALSVDPPEEDLMRRPPRDPRRALLARPVVGLMLLGGIWSAGANLGLFVWALGSGRSQEEAMTMTFVSLVLIQFFKAYNYRSDHLSVFHRPFANRWLNLAILWELALLALILYLPVLKAPFGTHSLPAADWAIVAGVGFTIFPVLEAGKWMLRRGWLGRAA